nr:restriction endonuclease subunit S [Treponema putidum]
MHNRHYEKFADGRVKDIEDEIPFAEPEGWAWCRLGEIYYHTTGKALKKSNEKGSLKKYITTSNLYWDTFDFSKVRSMYFTDEELDKCTIKKGDLVVCNGGDVGRAAIWNYDHDICYQNHVSRMRPKINGVENRFFLYVLMFYKEQNLLSGKGIGISSLSASDLLSAIVPLPPTNQQRLIVSEIQKIFAQIDLLEQNKVDLQTAVKQAKSKILDLAIRGKLVPQDPADEPASVMLEKLRAEKEAKIAAGEIKRDKNDSYIYKNSTIMRSSLEKKIFLLIMRFLLNCRQNGDGAGWGKWCDYGKCENIEVFKLKPDDWILDLEDIEKDSGKIITFHSFAERRSESTKHIFRKGDLLYSKLRPYLNKVVIAPKDGFCTSEILPLNFNGVLLNEFAQRLLMSFFFLSTVNMLVYGVKMPRLGRDDAKKIFIPIPPISEQKRIVAKIEEIFNALDDIQRNLI